MSRPRNESALDFIPPIMVLTQIIAEKIADQRDLSFFDSKRENIVKTYNSKMRSILGLPENYKRGFHFKARYTVLDHFGIIPIDLVIYSIAIDRVKG